MREPFHSNAGMLSLELSQGNEGGLCKLLTASSDSLLLYSGHVAMVPQSPGSGSLSADISAIC